VADQVVWTSCVNDEGWPSGSVFGSDPKPPKAAAVQAVVVSIGAQARAHSRAVIVRETNESEPFEDASSRANVVKHRSV